MSLALAEHELTVDLHGIGRIPALHAGEIAAGGVIVWSSQLTTVVEHVAPRGHGHVEVIERSNTTGKTYARNYLTHRALAYFPDAHGANAVRVDRQFDTTVEDVDAEALVAHIGREVSTPHGWCVLADVTVADVAVHAIVSGPLHQLSLYSGQVVGVRGGTVAVEGCGCLTAAIEQMEGNHRPGCGRAQGLSYRAPHGITAYFSDNSGPFGCTGCLYVWQPYARYYQFTRKSDTCPAHGAAATGGQR